MVGIPFYKPKAVPIGVYQNQEFPWAKETWWAKLNVSFVRPFFRIAHGRPGHEDGEFHLLIRSYRALPAGSALEAKLIIQIHGSCNLMVKQSW